MCKWMWCGNLVQSSMHARVTSAKRDWHQMYSVTTMEKQGAIFHILIVNRGRFTLGYWQLLWRCRFSREDTCSLS
ncbi:hypothetical protein HBI56_009340 [Parastagonospora nodorum]|uniref:Uncharacterized protein n=1 Tax=Phaeosphaeria nodorum (strain SN15 / ATCC MYA-4574 / FGSC 10173) TaxID=321614 RepID=A0A7U2EQ78_PHANO|nr:hypothetical protein HBH56_236810 [Parastagonospora nodorum]QRC90891.1 hypothetical protein JI435_004120 [Parastagonospora nodorum SN15]KAH3934914.1 hypothetical protein HBH54_045920 [Parastagonospora nodorum]KAH3950218.1 hypothetical protein HBH53_078040 [Parastagonospora nodorum]KAH3986693.1 hypothetical protein HBH51_011090 [Parastagonospora nodorum]